jgi:hypothetical protein
MGDVEEKQLQEQEEQQQQEEEEEEEEEEGDENYWEQVEAVCLLIGCVSINRLCVY